MTIELFTLFSLYIYEVQRRLLCQKIYKSFVGFYITQE